jgi:hypothetical protein
MKDAHGKSQEEYWRHWRGSGRGIEKRKTESGVEKAERIPSMLF